MSILLLYLLIMNALCFLLMREDKLRAIRKQWRIPEKVLFAVAFLGGSLGGCLAMKLYRHKTKHPKFQYGFPILFIIHACLLLWADPSLATYFS